MIKKKQNFEIISGEKKWNYMIGKGRKSAGNLKMRAVQNLPNPSDDVAFIKYFPEP